MALVINKKQKMLKCCHVWLGLYKQALADGQKPVFETVVLDEETSTRRSPDKRKERTSNFLEPPPAKKLLGAHMDPDCVSAKASISAIIEKHKAKSESSKGSLSTGAKASVKKGVEIASTSGGGQIM